MAAKIGILAESTVVTTQVTTTVYTVPADKAARVRILFLRENAGYTAHYKVLIGSPGTELTLHKGVTANQDCWTGSRLSSANDPASSVRAGDMGIQDFAAGDFDSVTGTGDWIVAPLSFDYFLATGDTVRFYHGGGNDAVDHLIQVMGVEDDA
jgi:hypothetical protein